MRKEGRKPGLCGILKETDFRACTSDDLTNEGKGRNNDSYKADIPSDLNSFAGGQGQKPGQSWVKTQCEQRKWGA